MSFCRGPDFVHLSGTPERFFLETAHEVQFAPSKRFFLDTHSTTSRPPVTELRRADGRLLQTLATANIDALKELKWHPPEHFVAKAADGNAEAYGILDKPYDFDPSRKYPVIQLEYLGFRGESLPRPRSRPRRQGCRSAC